MARRVRHLGIGEVLMADEKDRFGSKLKEVERGREDQYFAKRDRELIERLRKSQGDEATAALKQAAHMRCPKCGTHLDTRIFHEVTVEECPSCRGMWLDQGELEKIAGLESDGWISRWLRLEFSKAE